MENKGIVFTKPNVAEFMDFQMPIIGERDVLIRVVVSTISSGTERANLTGDANVSGRNAPNVTFPRHTGHSSAGIVEAVGEKVKSIKVGERVVASWGFHRQYIVLPEQNVHKIMGEEVSFEEVALWHISTFPLAAIRKCRLEIGESAIVMGMGVLGMMAVKLLKAAGAAPIIAVDPVREKRELALQIGADYAYDPFAPDFVEQVMTVTNGGMHVAIEVTGNGKALDQVLDCMRKFGRVALLGCTRNSDFTIDYYRKVHCPGIQMIGAHTQARPESESSAGNWTTHDDVMAVQTLHRLGRIQFADLVSEVHSPEEAPQIYTRLANEKAFPVVQFDWRKLS